MTGQEQAKTDPIWRDPEYLRGAREMLPIVPGVAAWGVVTGVTMVNSGIGLPLAVVMCLTVFSGTAQLATLPLFVSGAPLWVIWTTAGCLNLRFVIFSMGWKPYFHHLPRGMRLRIAYFSADLNYIFFARRFPDPKAAPEQLPYFWGGALTNWGAWMGSSLLGIYLGDAVPMSWGIGFAGTLALLGMTASLLGGRITWVALGVAGTASVAAYALPLKLNIVVAVAAAVAAGLIMEAAADRRKVGVGSAGGRP
jgi:predicted branched-subunit amino acid permease